MGLHEKRYNPEGKLVVAKADGLRFNGRSYHQGDAISDPMLTMRKARQLYFQNKLCYDYELADRAEQIAENNRVRAEIAARVEAERAERAALAANDAVAAEAARVVADSRQQAALAHAMRQADIAAGRVVEEPAPHAAAPVLIPQIQVVETPVASEPVVETAPVVEAPATPAEAVSEAPVVVVEQPAPQAPADEFHVAVSPEQEASVDAAAGVTRRRRRAEAPVTEAAPQE
jgi:hypothetical protein